MCTRGGAAQQVGDVLADHRLPAPPDPERDVERRPSLLVLEIELRETHGRGDVGGVEFQRLSVPMTYYRDIRRRFEDAGLRIYLYNVNFNETFTDAERDRTFEAARELGAEGFSSSTVLSEARRLVPFVQKHKMFVAMHNHNNLVDPDQFATPESFETALGMSEYFKVTLDIGHFTAGNQDAVAFVRKHHARIVNIHVRDRKRDNGPNRPFGEGDTPIKEVLRLIRDNRYPIRCYLEYEYGSFRSSLDEVKRCLEYCRQALA